MLASTFFTSPGSDVIHFLSTLFSWPDGIVVGNLIASAIWAVPAVLHLDKLARKHHKEHMEAIRGHKRDSSINS